MKLQAYNKDRTEKVTIDSVDLDYICSGYELYTDDTAAFLVEYNTKDAEYDKSGLFVTDGHGVIETFPSDGTEDSDKTAVNAMGQYFRQLYNKLNTEGGWEFTEEAHDDCYNRYYIRRTA